MTGICRRYIPVSFLINFHPVALKQNISFLSAEFPLAIATKNIITFCYYFVFKYYYLLKDKIVQIWYSLCNNAHKYLKMSIYKKYEDYEQADTCCRRRQGY